MKFWLLIIEAFIFVDCRDGNERILRLINLDYSMFKKLVTFKAAQLCFTSIVTVDFF